ncbi:hypothetical protein SteCoe_32510 [Stentor coeruleus]|uniref:Mitochondrial carrier protein n=1 Tax=Stentor coeruleus TaxID=5963 RepID=A0A1R2AZ96_9CILI|nr:hypothetical protein SteCoe_32510 [Stentor coeruleus]
MDRKKCSRPEVNFISGLLAGLNNAIICAPLDTAKTRLQIQGLYNKSYSGTTQTLSMIYKTEGIRGLYQGSSITILAYPLSWSLYFIIYEYLKSVTNDYTSSSLYSNILSASGAGLVSTVVTNPLWLIRVRLQAQREKTNSGWEIGKNLIQKEGFLSLYRGFSASLLGVGHVIIYFPMYEYFKEHIYNEDQPTLIGVLISSWIPKVCASAVSYPHELIRARIYTHDATQDKRFCGFKGLIMFTFNTEGFKGFYGGFFTNIFRILPSTFVTLYTYEKVKYFLEHN